MNVETDRPPLPRTVLLMDFLIKRLRAVPPFSFNAGSALIAVGGGLLLPQRFGRLAGSLLEMQWLVIISIVWLLILLLAKQGHIVQARRKSRDPKVVRGELRFLTWIFDFVFVIALLLSIKVGGPFGPLEFTFLAGAAVIGGAGEEHDAREIAELACRLAAAVIALIVVAFVFSLPTQHDQLPGAGGSIASAGVYFGALGLAEAAGIYPPLARFLLKAADRVRRGLS